MKTKYFFLHHKGSTQTGGHLKRRHINQRRVDGLRRNRAEQRGPVDGASDAGVPPPTKPCFHVSVAECALHVYAHRKCGQKLSNTLVLLAGCGETLARVGGGQGRTLGPPLLCSSGQGGPRIPLAPDWRSPDGAPCRDVYISSGDYWWLISNTYRVVANK